MITAATPELFAPPVPERGVQFLSSADFDARLPELCAKIRKCITNEQCDHVLLWVQEPGKSNFWMALKCWPYLRDVVDEVWSTKAENDPYGGGGYTNAHIYLDDALFTGEQMSKLLCETYWFQPPYASDGTDEHLWIVGAMAASDAAEDRIAICVKRGDANYCLDDDGYESDPVQTRIAKCVSEFPLVPDKNENYKYYTGFKVPDSFSVAELVQMVEAGTIPGLTLADLTTGPGIVTVRSPQPPYRALKLEWKGKPLVQFSLVL